MKTLFCDNAGSARLADAERIASLERENSDLRAEVERLKAERDRLIGLVSEGRAGS